MDIKRLEAGETIVETLVAILIVTLSMVFLANAVVSASRVNAAIDSEDTSFDTASSEEVESGPVTLTVQGSDPNKPTSQTVSVKVYKTENEKTENEYYYYE